MIPLDEYIEENHKELSEDIKCHLRQYAHADPKTAEGLHRLFFMSLRQYEYSNKGFWGRTAARLQQRVSVLDEELTTLRDLLGQALSCVESWEPDLSIKIKEHLK